MYILTQPASRQRRAHRERRPRLASPHLTMPRLASPRLATARPVRARITARERAPLSRATRTGRTVSRAVAAGQRSVTSRNETRELSFTCLPPRPPLVTWLTPPLPSRSALADSGVARLSLASPEISRPRPTVVVVVSRRRCSPSRRRSRAFLHALFGENDNDRARRRMLATNLLTFFFGFNTHTHGHFGEV